MDLRILVQQWQTTPQALYSTTNTTSSHWRNLFLSLNRSSLALGCVLLFCSSLSLAMQLRFILFSYFLEWLKPLDLMHSDLKVYLSWCIAICFFPKSAPNFLRLTFWSGFVYLLFFFLPSLWGSPLRCAVDLHVAVIYCCCWLHPSIIYLGKSHNKSPLPPLLNITIYVVLVMLCYCLPDFISCCNNICCWLHPLICHMI